MDMMQILFCLVITDAILWVAVLFIGLREVVKSDDSAIEFDTRMAKTLLAIAKALSFLALVVMLFISIYSLAMI